MEFFTEWLPSHIFQILFSRAVIFGVILLLGIFIIPLFRAIPIWRKLKKAEQNESAGKPEGKSYEIWIWVGIICLLLIIVLTISIRVFIDNTHANSEQIIAQNQELIANSAGNHFRYNHPYVALILLGAFVIAVLIRLGWDFLVEKFKKQGN